MVTPSHLAGDVVITEDDVLHLKSLPGDLGSAPRESPRVKNAPADRKAKLKALEVRVAALAGGKGTLPPRDVERLLCALTAPYLRLPLVLRFFADARRSRSLRDARLQILCGSVFVRTGALAAGPAVSTGGCYTSNPQGSFADAVRCLVQ